MKGQLISGIDIGTHNIKVVVAHIDNNGALTVRGAGSLQADGMRNGYIVDVPSTSKAVQRALDDIVKQVGTRPSKAYLSIGGVSISTLSTPGTAHITTTEGIISGTDVSKVIKDASSKSEHALVNRKVLHELPLGYHIDGTIALADPVGMRGTKLSGDVLFVHALEKHIDDFISAVENAGVEVLDVTAGPLAASFAALTTPQKMQGCVLVDIGAESTDVSVFEHNLPQSITVLPMGGNDITNNLAVALRVSVAEADAIKRAPSQSGTQLKTVEKVINQALTDLFSEVKKSVNRARPKAILPGGILITGGGSLTPGTVDIAKRVLGLPARTTRATARGVDHSPELTVAYGLCVWGAANEDESSFTGVKDFLNKAWGWFKQFLP